MKVSTLVSAALLAAVQITNAIPLATPADDATLMLDERDDPDYLTIRGVGYHHERLLPRSAATDLKYKLGDLANKLTAAATSGISKGVRGNSKPAVTDTIPQRLEIRTLYSTKRRTYELYLLAIRRLKSRGKADKNSFYQMAGIHGRPFTAWNGRNPGNPVGGYCTHGSTLFPTWHRPYLAYFEELVWLNAFQIVETQVKTEAEKQLWRPALDELRIPYWDWALDTDSGQMPKQIAQEKWTFIYYPNMASGKTVTYDNPLYNYNFFEASQHDASTFGGTPWTTWQHTLRSPTSSGTSSISASNAILKSNYKSLQQRVSQLLLGQTQWSAFSNHAGTGSDSLEAIHDAIHSFVGNNGHMSYVEYSSFDPIFFLHHTNIDRLFALWQAINYASTKSGSSNFATGQTNGGGTFGRSAGEWDDINTPLEPFRRDDGNAYTSADTRETAWFGYSYPELGGHGIYVSNGAALAKSVKTAVGKLYPNSVSASSKRKRDDGGVTEGIDKSILGAGQYYEWRIDLVADKSALNGTYIVHFFLGKPSKNPEDWSTQKEHAGDYAIFTHNMAAAPGIDPDTINNNVTGTVPLTAAMINNFSGSLNSLNPSDASTWLVKNLRWRVTDITGKSYRVKDVRGLNVAVSISLCTLPTAEQPWTEYGEWTHLTDIVKKIGRDGGPDKVGVIPNASTTTVASTSTTATPTTTEAATTEAPTTTEAPATTTDEPVTTSSTDVPTETTSVAPTPTD